MGVADDRIYLDQGLTGTKRLRPGPDQALAAVRAGDTLVVTKLDRLARSAPDARAIGASLEERDVRLSLGGSVYDPTDPFGKLFFNILATFAEFEVDVLRARTREGMAIAKAKGKLKGRQPTLSAVQQRELVKMHAAGEHSIADLAAIFLDLTRHGLPHPRTRRGSRFMLTPGFRKIASVCRGPGRRGCVSF